VYEILAYIADSKVLVGVATIVTICGVTMRDVITRIYLSFSTKDQERSELVSKEASASKEPKPRSSDSEIRLLPGKYAFVVMRAQDQPPDPVPSFLPSLIFPMTGLLFGFLICAALPGLWALLGVPITIALVAGGFWLAFVVRESNWVLLDVERKVALIFHRGWPLLRREPAIAYNAEQVGLETWQAQVSFLGKNHSQSWVVYEGDKFNTREAAWAQAKPFAQELCSAVSGRLHKSQYDWRSWRIQAEKVRLAMTAGAST